MVSAQAQIPSGHPPPPDTERPVAGRHRWLTRRHLQIALGLLWLLDGALQLQPYMFRAGSNGFLGPLAENTMGRPNLLTDLIRMAVNLFAAHQVLYNSCFAVLQILIGIGICWRRALRPALAVSVAWGLVVWVLGEALGQMTVPQASTPFGAPGAALLYILAALMLWPRQWGHGHLTAGERCVGPGPPGTHELEPAVADSGLLGIKGSRWAWAAVWGGTALLELELANHSANSVSAQLANQASGQPGLLAGLDRGAAHLLAGHGVEVALGVLVVQVFIAQGVLRGTTRRLALGIGMGVALVYWVVAQNFGGIFTGQATDPNSGPLWVLLALLLWPRRACILNHEKI